MKIVIKIVLPILFILEIGFLTFLREPIFRGGNDWNSIILCLIGLLIGGIAIFHSNIIPVKSSSFSISSKNHFLQNKHLQLFLLLFISWLGFVISLPEILSIYEAYPILPKYADILPQIDKMLDLFLAGENPYASIKVHHDYKLVSPYMPFHWAPMLIPKITGIDLRFATLGIWLLSISFFAFTIFKLRINYFIKIGLILLPAIFLNILVQNQTIIFRISAELIIAAYYLFLATSLLNKSTVWVGIALLTCLLSRYFVVLWVPLLLFVWWDQYGNKSIFKLSGIVAGGVLLFYLIPFMSQNIQHIPQGIAHHGKVTQKVWTYEPWHAKTIDKPATLFKGLGLASYFYDYGNGEVLGRLKTIQRSQIILSLMVIFLLGVFYWKRKDRLNSSDFLLGSLKVYMVIFYQLLPLPIEYYFFVPVCISIPILVIPFKLQNDTLSATDRL